MRLDRTMTIFATIGGAALGYFAATTLLGMRERQGRGAALSEGDRFAAGDVGATRSAGRDAMRDPPRDWSAADQAADESFPASDPAPFGSRVD